MTRLGFSSPGLYFLAPREASGIIRHQTGRTKQQKQPVVEEHRVTFEENARESVRAAGSGTAPTGLRIATSSRPTATEAIAEIARALVGPAGYSDIGFLLVFASSKFDPQEIVDALDAHIPNLPHAGCSTAGEIGLDGLGDGSIVAMAFLKGDFEIVAAPMEALSDFGIEKGGELVLDLKRRLPSLAAGVVDDVFALTLLDGLCQREELVLSALQRALDDIPLVGGSSGDDLTFQDTFVFKDGRVMRDAGLLLLVRTSHPFRVFKSDHFEATAKKMVVTACDPDARVVSELDAEPAWSAFADAAGLDPDDLSGMSFAAHPLLVRVGGEYYCRSIQKMNADGSLSFYCAIDTGVVLTVAQTKDMVASLEEALTHLDRELDGLDFVLGFDCVHRRLEAENRQVIRQISDIFAKFRVVGFNTYGEQFNAMHLNHTFTGVAFGRRREG